jgi:DNA-directed RNA polymerase specialized sigma24 family protein
LYPAGKRPLRLRDLEQLETREVAEVMGISEETIKMRLHRARVHVRNAMTIRACRE